MKYDWYDTRGNWKKLPGGLAPRKNWISTDNFKGPSSAPEKRKDSRSLEDFTLDILSEADKFIA